MKWITLLLAAMFFTSQACADEFDPPQAIAGKFSGTVTGKVNWVHNSNTWLMFWVESIAPDANAGEARQFEPLIKLDQGLKINIEWSPGANPLHVDFIKTLKTGDRFTLKLTPTWDKTGVRLAEVPAGKLAAAAASMAPPAAPPAPAPIETGIVDANGFLMVARPALQEPLKKVDVSWVHGAVVDDSKINDELYVSVSAAGARDDNPGTRQQPTRTFGAALKKAMAAMTQGKSVRIHLAAGEYREGEFEVNGKETPGITEPLLVIEGEAPGKVIFKGSDPITTWTSGGQGIYSAPWPHKLGFWPGLMGQYNIKELLGQRREMVFVDGKFQIPVLLERHRFDQKKLVGDEGKAAPGQHGGDMEYEQVGRWTYLDCNAPATSLIPGSFGVTERKENGEKLWLKMADGGDPSGHKVEAATRKWFMRVAHKSNFVLRNITIEHFASSYFAEDGWRRNGALQFGIGGEGTIQQHDILVENLTLRWNSGAAADFGATRGLTVRNLTSNYNGCGGTSHGGIIDMVWENVTTNFNNWRGVLGNCYGWAMAGTKFHTFRDAIIRNHVAIGNQTLGLWYDVNAVNVLMDAPVSYANFDGLFLEICKGPLEVRNGLFAENSGAGIRILDAEHVTLKNNLVWNGPATAATAAEVAEYEKDINKSANLVRAALFLHHYPRSSMSNSANWDTLTEAMFGPKMHIAYWLPGPLLVEGNAFIAESPFREVLVHCQWLPPDLRRPEMWKRSYGGKDNLFYAAAGKPILYNDFEKPEAPAGVRTTRWELTRWGESFSESGGRTDKPMLMDPEHGDFRLATGSPLVGQAGNPAYRQLDASVLQELKAYRELVKQLEIAREQARK